MISRNHNERPAMHDDNELPENWQELDSIAVFYEYVALVRERWQAGERALPP